MTWGSSFLSYQRNIQRQFETVQARLIDEPLAEVTIRPFGGGYFLVLPGVTDRRDFLGRALLS